jgi:hypothetical protein
MQITAEPSHCVHACIAIRTCHLLAEPASKIIDETAKGDNHERLD